MFDPFDAFDPIDPVPAPPEARDEERVDGLEATDEVEAAPETTPAPSEPRATAEPDRPALRPTRRWTVTASRPVQPAMGNGTSPSGTARTAPRASEAPDLPPPADAATEPAAPSVPLADLAAFRAATLSELRAAVERLRAHGHEASVRDALDADQPSVTVRFKPTTGPLTPASESPEDAARFELRLAADLDGGTQVVAGYTRAVMDAPFTLLGRTHVDRIDRGWVARRFVEFVQKVLEIR